MAPRSNARERILTEAMRLFAERGYERTSIADIQTAAGLTPGSGALYKHFPSKEALLQAGMAQFIDTNVRARSLLKPPPDSAREALRFLGVEAMRILRDERNDIRVAWRELEAFAALHDSVEKGVMQANYRTVAAWLEQRIRSGELPPQDSEAVAVVLLGGLVMFRLYEAMWGKSPLGISAERFVDAWEHVATDGIYQAPPPAASPKKRRPKAKPRSTSSRKPKSG
jgi:AcrR family transcriptional regulator